MARGRQLAQHLAVHPVADADLQLVHATEVPPQGTRRAVDLDPVRVLLPHRRPARLEDAPRAVREAEQCVHVVLVLDVAETRAGATKTGKGFRLGRRREILEVTRALASLLPVGMPLAQALQAASNVATGDVRAATVGYSSSSDDLRRMFGSPDRVEAANYKFGIERVLFYHLPGWWPRSMIEAAG